MLLPALALGEATPTPTLPMDFTPGHVADPANYTENGYEDETLSVTMERVWVGDAQFNVARVKIADPSQLRIGLAAPFGTKKTNRVSTIAGTTTRWWPSAATTSPTRKAATWCAWVEAYRKKPLKSRDMLVTDSKGNFHILKNSDATQLQALMEAEDPIVNVFNFGPALVIDGVLQEMPETYKYNINGKEPRCAIGQLGELEYLLVVVDGRGAADSEGCDVATLAQFMYDQGCTQAYNLDGGNSALMYFNGENYSRKSFEAERSVSDIIYFSTAIDYGLDETAEEE